MRENDEEDVLKANSAPLRWVPTEYMLADTLTKIMDAPELMEVLNTGRVQLPVKADKRPKPPGR